MAALLAATVDEVGLGMQFVGVAAALPEADGAALMSGFTLLPPLALAKLHVNAAFPLCSLMFADLSLEFFGPPDDW